MARTPASTTVRAQNELVAGEDDRFRYPMAASGQPVNEVVSASASIYADDFVQPAQFTDASATQAAASAWGTPPPSVYSGTNLPARTPSPSTARDSWQPGADRLSQLGGPGEIPPPTVGTGASPLPGPDNPYPLSPTYSADILPPAAGVVPAPSGPLGVPTPYADIFVNVQETQTGRLMLGAAVNSDAGLTGQLVIEEKNFNWRRVPRSFDDLFSGTAFRGAGQDFRLEAMPGDQVQRYMVNFTEPYLNGTRISMNLSGYLYDRRYFDWSEQRLGGRMGFGYRVTPDMSVNFTFKGEEVTISDIRIPGHPVLDAMVGDHDLYSGRVALTQDTRDIPFAPTQGYYLELAFEQTFGSFDYPRGNVNFQRFILLNERPDGSGRHVLSFSNRLAASGNQTP
ncbi:MAG: BamA/TamA family outer membrane protein, partial [Planctomycetales bacterium]|nr:BamA/TamA family outer membrane protein [Planctomycetales bacterium]